MSREAHLRDLASQLTELAAANNLNYVKQDNYTNPREEAIAKLSKIKATIAIKDWRAVTTKLPRKVRARLLDLSEAEKNRREQPTLGSISLGDRLICSGVDYPRLKGVEVRVVEFRDCWVQCITKSGTYCPALLPDDFCELSTIPLEIPTLEIPALEITTLTGV